MTEKFPDIQNLQVALLRADINTGHVLDENFNLAINGNQKVFSVFDVIDCAIDFAKSIISNKKDIECNLYAQEMKFLRSITYKDL